MTENTPLPFDLPAVHRKKVTVDFNGSNQSSDAGLLLLREAERKLGVCQLACGGDSRPPRSGSHPRILHTMHEMLMARVSAIACGYEEC
jgi:Transposase DDE domain group 1